MNDGTRDYSFFSLAKKKKKGGGEGKPEKPRLITQHYKYKVLAYAKPLINQLGIRFVYMQSAYKMATIKFSKHTDTVYLLLT
jgi:hypothetical protein